MRQLLATVAPTILFPYAREAIDNLVVKGGFPALMIAPVNFDALYRQAVAQQAAEAGEGGQIAPGLHALSHAEFLRRQVGS